MSNKIKETKGVTRLELEKLKVRKVYKRDLQR